MSTEEVFKEITKNKKWYVGVYKQQTASAICKRFNSKTLSHEKLNDFFKKFGYEKSPDNWEINI